MLVSAICRLLAALALVLACAGPAAAKRVEIGPEALRDQAARAAAAGFSQRALSYSDALLRRDPKDIGAWLIRAQAARDMGRYEDSRGAARRAWGLAGTDRQRYAAALAMAQAQSSAGRRTSAQWWLRRAVQNAPDDTARARAVRDFRYVRARNPWAADFSFSIAPRSNVNNGSARSTTQLFDLPFEFQLDGSAQALSGIEVAAGANLRYRLNESRTRRSDLLLRFHHRTYALSDAAKAQAPGVSGSDFAFTSAGIGLVHRTRPDKRGAPRQFHGIIGRTWYAGDPYMQFVQLGATQHFGLSPRTGADFSLGVEAQEGLSRGSDARSVQLGAGLTRILPGGHRLRLSVEGRVNRSGSANLDFDKLAVGARLKLARPVLGMQLSMGLSGSVKDHDRSPLSANGRHDEELGIEVTAGFPSVDYYGFIPSATVRAARTRSDIGLYDTNELGVEIGIRSAF